ncbi:MAG: heavy-metal-associated domain-containing protein [Planctomycetota bacterium]|jgi:hypothetical protein
MDTVKVRIFTRSTLDAEKVKSSLDADKFIKNASVDADAKTATFTFSGPLSQLRDLEKRLKKQGVTSALVSHAFIKYKLSPPREFSLAAFQKGLKALPGVKRVNSVNKRDGEFIADLSLFDVQKLFDLAENAKAKISLQTHEMVQVTLKNGGADGLVDGLAAAEKVLVVKLLEDKVVLLTLKPFSDQTVRRLAKKLKLEIEKIEHVS